MKIGDLVRSLHNGELLIIISEENNGYHDVCDPKGEQWHMPKEHLERL